MTTLIALMLSLTACRPIPAHQLVSNPFPLRFHGKVETANSATMRCAETSGKELFCAVNME
jgi:hypothetical protein